MENNKILIVEDEEIIRLGLKDNFELENYIVETAGDGDEAIEKADSFIPDLVILDLMIPKKSGFEVCRYIRKKHPDTFIIMLTAKTEETSKVTGLEMGADDYVTKPFGMMVLVSRIKAVLRRYEKSDLKKEILEAGGIKLDENQHTVFADSQQIFLTVKEFDLLLLLMKNRGNVLTRELLLESVWDLSSDIESRTVDVHIRTLRAKLGKYEKTIETIRGVGYKFV